MTVPAFLRVGRLARRIAMLAALPVACAVAGCADLSGGVMPWQKGDLARPEMGFDASGLAQRYGEQVHASREAASGGSGVGGGGCGCN
jgi:hypothetical protein